MKICKTVTDGVQAALDVFDFTPKQSWTYLPAAENDYTDSLILNGVKYPLFWWRCDTQIVQMYQFAPSRKPCSIKLNRTCAKSMGLDRLFYKELDIAEYLLHAQIVDVMCMKNGQSMNILATYDNGRVALFELAATLHDGTSEQGRHTFWGEDGMASDRVVSQKVPSEAVYLYTEDQPGAKLYSDIFIHMYGLDKESVLKATAIAEILMGRRDISDWLERDAHYRQCIAVAQNSAETMRRMNVKEVSAWNG